MFERQDAPGEAQGNDDARPASGADQQQTTTPAPSAPEAPPAAPASAEDADLAAHRALLAAAEAEERGEQPPAPPSQAATTEQPPSQPTAPPASPTAPRPGPVPYERFVEATRRLREAEAEAAYQRGVAEALRERGASPPTEAPPAPGQQPPAPPAPPSQADAIAAAEQAALEAAEKFDRGEITATELSRAQMAAARAIADARVAERIATTQPAQPGQGSMVDGILVQRHSEQLEARHPALTVLTEAQMNSLVRRAHEDAALAGKPYGKGPMEDWRLREHVAQLATAHIPIWNLRVPQQPNTAPSSPPPNAQQPGLSPTAAARLKKMDQAAGLPPDTAAMGAAPATSPAVSEAAILAMSDDEIAERMPASVRRQFLTG